MATGTITKRFYGPFCHWRAKDAMHVLIDRSFEIGTVESISWKNPRTWFATTLEIGYCFTEQSVDDVLDGVRRVFSTDFFPPKGWKEWELPRLKKSGKKQACSA